MEFAIPAALAGLGGGISAFSNILAGKEQSAASRFEAGQLDAQGKQLDMQAKAYNTVGAQTETARRDDLVSSLETIEAIRAGRGVGGGSPTGSAIYDHLVRTEERNAQTERLNYALQADTARLGAESVRQHALLLRRSAKRAMLSGYLGAGQSFASLGLPLYQLYDINHLNSIAASVARKPQ